MIVALLSELDAGADHGARAFYDRLCEALCRLTTMRRAGLLLYDESRRLVVPVGSHGVPRDLLEQIYGTLEETPIAQRALAEDRVVVASDPELGVPGRYQHFAGVTTLTCTPVSAGGRWLGILIADRGGGRFEVSDDERDTLWSLGKTAAVVASAQLATDRSARAQTARGADRPRTGDPRARDPAPVWHRLGAGVVRPHRGRRAGPLRARGGGDAGGPRLGPGSAARRRSSPRPTGPRCGRSWNGSRASTATPGWRCHGG